MIPLTFRLQPRHSRSLILLCLLVTLVGSAVGIALPAGLGWDFANFYDTGRRVAAGQYDDLYDEYSKIDGEDPQGHMRFYGVPLSGFFYVPLAWFGPATASRLLKLQCFLALAISLFVLYRHAGQFVTPTDECRRSFALSFVALVAVYQPFWTIYRVGGQTTPTVVLLLIAAMLSYLRGRTIATAFLLTVVILVKPAFVLPVGLLAIASGLPLIVALTVAGAVATGLSIILVGYAPNVEFLNLMLVSANTSVTWVFNSASTVAIENLRLLDDAQPFRSPRPADLSHWVNGIRLAFGLLFVGYAWQVHRIDQRRDTATCRLLIFLGSISFGMALMPILWEHYLSVLFIPLIYAIAVQDRLSRTARVITWTALGLAATQNLILIQWIDRHWSVSTWTEAILSGLAKGGPCLLTMFVLAVYRRNFYSAMLAEPRETTLRDV